MSEAGRKALVVVNTQSRGSKLADTYLDLLEEGGMTLVRRDCYRRDKLPELITEMRDQVDCVVLAGGGGTMSAAAIALRDTGLPLGIVPLGANNDLAQSLGIPLDPEGAAAVILDGATRQVDLGSVNGRPFFTVASVGLTIEDSRRLNHSAQRSLGSLTYFWSALSVMLGSKRFSAIIRCGATIHRVRTVQIAIGNGRLWSGGMPVELVPGEADHLLDVYSLEPESKWRLLFSPDTFNDDADLDTGFIRAVRSPVVEVVTRLPLTIVADGENVSLTPARFSVLPQAVTVFAPEIDPAYTNETGDEPELQPEAEGE